MGGTTPCVRFSASLSSSSPALITRPSTGNRWLCGWADSTRAFRFRPIAHTFRLNYFLRTKSMACVRAVLSAGFDFRVLFRLPFWTSKKVTDAPKHHQVASHFPGPPISFFDRTIPILTTTHSICQSFLFAFAIVCSLFCPTHSIDFTATSASQQYNLQDYPSLFRST